MHRSLARFAAYCDAVNDHIGRGLSWLTVAVVVLMFANVLLRYLFDSGAPWQMELVQALHAAVFLGVMGYTLQKGEHVRVDVLYTHMSARKKAWVELVGTCVLLLPVCIALMWFAWPYVASSWELREASSEYNGLQGMFLLKTFLLIGPALLALQGIACAIRALAVLTEVQNG